MNIRMTVITYELFRASLSIFLFFLFVSQCFCSKSYFARIMILHAPYGW